MATSAGSSGSAVRPYNKHYRMEDLQILKTIATGSFARVCLCRERATGAYRAIKMFSIARQVALGKVQHVLNEKNVLRLVDHPFIVKLLWHHHDSTFVYLLLEYVNGGELFYHLRKMGKFPLQTAKFYASEVVSALSYLHSLSIVYRDIKPENLVIDRDGHLKITDFGFSKHISGRTWTLCGTPQYMAPEIILGIGHGTAVDWWALGVLIYEMLLGEPPFDDDSNPHAIYSKILVGKITFPIVIDSSATELIRKLVETKASKRLGNLTNGAEDVKEHRFFNDIVWDDIYNKRLMPPIVPTVISDSDTRNFGDYEEDNWRATPAASKAQVACFEDF